MATTPVPGGTEQEPRNLETPRWLRLLQDWKALAWPVLAALLAAIFYFLGYAFDNGRVAALGIYNLDRPSITQGYVITGVSVLAALGLQLIIIVIIAIGLRAIAGRGAGLLPDGLRMHVAAIPRSAAWAWSIVMAAVATSAFGLWFAGELVDDADGMILKKAKELGTAWFRMSLDQERDWQIVYELLLAATITILTVLTWWILTRFFKNTTARIVYGAWAVIQAFNLVASYAFILGAAATFQSYPVVSFYSQEQQLGKGAVPILIGSDEREYAFLVIYGAGSGTHDPTKFILYVPRSEVRWMAVLRQEPLHIFALYPDLKPPVLTVPDNPESPKPSPSAEKPAR